LNVRTIHLYEGTCIYFVLNAGTIAQIRIHIVTGGWGFRGVKESETYEQDRLEAAKISPYGRNLKDAEYEFVQLYEVYLLYFGLCCASLICKAEFPRSILIDCHPICPLASLRTFVAFLAARILIFAPNFIPIFA
jgi:hypothetical protein